MGVPDSPPTSLPLCSPPTPPSLRCHGIVLHFLGSILAHTPCRWDSAGPFISARAGPHSSKCPRRLQAHSSHAPALLGMGHFSFEALSSPSLQEAVSQPGAGRQGHEQGSCHPPRSEAPERPRPCIHHTLTHSLQCSCWAGSVCQVLEREAAGILESRVPIPAARTVTGQVSAHQSSVPRAGLPESWRGRGGTGRVGRGVSTCLKRTGKRAVTMDCPIWRVRARP